MSEEFNSPNFKPNFIRDLRDRWNEGSFFLDFKSEPYTMDTDENKNKFARHVIAFANIARRTGRSCYIVFGVDKGQKSWVSVLGKYVSERRKFTEDPSISIHTKQTDGVLEVYRNVLEKLIIPIVPDLLLHYGYVDDVFVSYLEILPTNTKTPFQSSKQFGIYPPKTTFIRCGSSSVQIGTEDSSRLCSISDVEYLFPTEWYQLFKHHVSGDFATSYTLSPAFEQTEANTNQKVREIVMEYIAAGHKSIVLVGEAGTGKTILLQKVAFEISNMQIQNKNIDLLEFAITEEEGRLIKTPVSLKDLEKVPSTKIPIYIELRKIATFRDASELDKYCQRVIEKVIDRKVESLNHILKISESRWIFLLDGLDEIFYGANANVVLREWIQLLPINVQVIITSRPYCFDKKLAEKSIFIRLLNNDEIRYLLKGNIITNSNNGEIRGEEYQYLSERLVNALDNSPEFYDLLRRPRAIVGLANYYANINQYKPLIDKDFVTITKDDILIPNKGENKAQFGMLPIINGDISTDGSINEETKTDGSITDEPNEQNRIEEQFEFNRAIAVRVTLQYLQNEEVKRQREEQMAGRAAEEAFYDLQKLAWFKTDWDEVLFRETESLKKSVLWALFIGFAETIKYPLCKFPAELSRCYFAASYAFDNESDEVKIRNMFSKNSTKRYTNKIIILLNELRLSSGKAEINI